MSLFRRQSRPRRVINSKKKASFKFLGKISVLCYILFYLLVNNFLRKWPLYFPSSMTSLPIVGVTLVIISLW